ncbi:MAG: CAP domain-containing protein [Treponema sp.]|nr:CAP domain-containing protein [Treponema sp.]
MKKHFCGLIILLASFTFVSCFLGIDLSDFFVNKTDEVQVCFDLVNEFRTGNEAWYWNTDDATKTNLVGKPGKLILDEELCKAAQIRVNEVVKKFDHERPNGKKWYTVLNECSIVAYSSGENIAAGNKSGKATFLQWKEDDKKYSGQGHRRNMLNPDFTKIGIAYTYDANSQYKYYWEMILAK